MKIIYVNDFNFQYIYEPVAIALGFFDGLHLAHQKIINQLNQSSFKKCLLTFEPSIKSFFQEDKTELTPLEHKIALLQSKLDYLLIIQTNENILNKSKQQFIDFLKLNQVKETYCGYDFSFGYDKEGKAKDLNCFSNHILEPFYLEGEVVSTTLCKKCLEEGDVAKVKDYLGRLYSVYGEVIYGSQLGRKIGFPTANIAYRNATLPKNGVYFGFIMSETQKIYGMINIGHNPTINFQNQVSLEVHLFDFDKDLYHQIVEVYFVSRIREEKKFNSKDELIKQLKEDQTKCLSLIEEIN